MAGGAPVQAGKVGTLVAALIIAEAGGHTGVPLWMSCAFCPVAWGKNICKLRWRSWRPRCGRAWWRESRGSWKLQSAWEKKSGMR